MEIYKQNLRQYNNFSLRVKKGCDEEVHSINFLSTQQHIRAPDDPARLFLGREFSTLQTVPDLRAALTGGSDGDTFGFEVVTYLKGARTNYY